MNRSLSLLVLAGLLAGCVRFQPKPISSAKSADDFDARSLNDSGLRQFLEANHATADWPRQSWDLNALTMAAFYYQPSLEVARAQWGVAQAGLKTAGGRPNPILSAVPGYTLNAASGVSPWIPLVSLDIPIETAGKRGYRIAQARHLSDAARLKIVSTAWQVRSSLRSSLLDFAAASQRAAFLQKQLQLQQQTVTLLEQRLAAGAVARTELTLPRIALTKAGADHAAATRQATEARARTAEAIGVPVKALEGLELTSPLAISAEAGKELTSAEARRQALLGRSDVLSALAEYAASQSALQLEIAKQYPDVHLNPGYQFDQGQDKWTLGISVELPVFNQNQGPIAETKAKREEAAARFLAVQAKVIADIDRTLAGRRAAMEQMTRQGELTKLAHEQSAAAENLFKAGASDKLELASAQLEATANELAYLDAQIQAQQAQAQLEEAIQRPVETWPALEQGRSAPTKKVKP